MLTDLILRLRALFKRTAIEHEIDEELRFHLDRQVESCKKAGLDRAEALRRTRLEFGGLDQVKEDYRDALGVGVVDDLWLDLRFALRVLRRDRWFTLAAVLILALGIGANTAVFSIVDSVLLRPLAYREPDRLFSVAEIVPQLSHLAPVFAVNAGTLWNGSAAALRSRPWRWSIAPNSI